MPRSRERSRSPRRKKSKKSKKARSRRSPSEDGSRSRRRRSPSAHSSSDDSVARLRRELAEKKRKREEKLRKSKSDKDARKMQKAGETPEERYKRKLAKRTKHQKDVFGYTDDNNPFGDSSLSKNFVWSKKIDHELETGKRSRRPNKKDLKHERESLLGEIERVKQRRRQRELELEEREAEKEEEQRLREMEQYGDWERKEEEFHARQAKRRSALRIKDGREKPIDLLAKNLIGVGDDKDDRTLNDLYDVNTEEPYLLFEDLPEEELRDLRKDIMLYVDAERNKLEVADRYVSGDVMQEDIGTMAIGSGDMNVGLSKMYLEYWEALLLVCDYETDQRVKEQSMTGRSVHATVNEDVKARMAGKSVAQLEVMETEIQSRLTANAAGIVVDEAYWNEVLQLLLVSKAKARLLELHKAMLLQKLEILERKQRETRSKASKHGGSGGGGGGGGGDAGAMHEMGKAGAVSDSDDGGVSPELQAHDDSDSGGVSPEPELDDGDDEDGEDAVVMDPEQAARLLQQQREEALASRAATRRQGRGDPQAGGTGGGAHSAEANAMWRAEAAKGGDADEEVMMAEEEVPTASDVYMWQDKYRPRKPRYFNRVKTGYDWNKYNQTHYDHDDPPPKTVQGYKFNIFYPDLIDKSQTPSYTIEPSDHPDFVIIRFTAGPPYEDIAFKIVNKEWEYSRDHGFRNIFDRGILQLYVNFKRHLYRR